MIRRPRYGLVSEPEERVDPILIEADHGLPVNDDHGCALEPPRQEILQGLLVLADVLLNEINAFLRKILLLSMTRRSTRLGEQDDGFCHVYLHRSVHNIGRSISQRAS